MPAIALIEFFLTDEEIVVFIVRSTQPALAIDDQEPLVFRVPFSRARLRRIADQLHQDLATAFTPDEVEKISLCDFFELGELIFNKDIRNALQHFDALYIVPFGELHHLPVHAFRIGKHYLLELYTIAYLPTATLLAYLPSGETQKSPRKLLAVGVDFYHQRKHFHLEAKEVFQLEDLWTEPALLIREQARRDRIIEAARDKDIIHFSTHGHFFPDDPLLSGISLYAGAGEQAKFAKGDFQEPADFYLSARSIMRDFQLKAELMVISGCVTGQTEIDAGEEPFGLYRSLLYAGAGALIVTLFPIFKNVTAKLAGGSGQPGISDFYSFWLAQGLSKADALRAYTLKIRNTPGYGHPAYWFSFIYIGKI